NVANPSEQNSPRLRIKVGSDKPVRNNNEIYNGPGLLLSPSSSTVNDSEDIGGSSIKSPGCMLRDMTSRFVPGDRLVSPLNESLLCLTKADRILGIKVALPVNQFVGRNAARVNGLGKKAKKEWVKELCNKNKKSDFFVMIRGVWRATGVKLMIIPVYAPHEQKEKHLLWDYLEREIKRWDGEVVTMGDFNEVRHKCERLGSVFNASEANVFNSFIVGSGLAEVVLGGSKFTWCHKSGSKMSKLDRSADISLFLKLKLDLESIDEIIDRGDRNDEIMCKRSGIINNLNDLSNIQTMEEDRQFIERDVSIDEIKKAVWDCGTEKAPGLDGFTFGFYRRY
nr:RNA-directed DNA polymerase, eukaryota [Tanacetum cinerariifolium]